jgi:DNA-binding NarL/FixJ family response regulator
MNPLRLVIADDHPIFRAGLRAVLARSPEIQVVGEAGDGAEALDQVRQFKPDIAIVDIDMPKCDGLRFAASVRDAQIPVKVVVLTAHPQKEMFDAFLDLGVAGYVLKENASAELIACLKAVAEGEPYVSPSLTRLLLRRRQAADQLRTERPGIDRLTPAERRILRLIAEDKTSKEIATQLGVSPNTVDNHRANICEKLGLRGTHSLLKFAFDNKSRLNAD